MDLQRSKCPPPRPCTPAMLRCSQGRPRELSRGPGVLPSLLWLLLSTLHLAQPTLKHTSREHLLKHS